MRKQMIISIVTILAAWVLITMPEYAKTGIRNGLTLISGVILPGLFPFFLLSEFWIRSGGALIFQRSARSVMKKLFHLPGAAAPAFILGAVGGYPVGAKTIARLYADGSLSKNDAEQTLLFCCNAGPAFVISVIGGFLFHQISLGVLLFFVHIISAILIGVLLRPKKLPDTKPNTTPRKKNSSLSTAVTQSIKAAGETMIHVSMVILLFSVVLEYFKLLLSVFAFRNLSVLPGILEITNGIDLLAQNNLPQQVNFAIAAFLTGFGGISIMLQSLSLLAPAGLSCKKLWIGKVLHGFISAAMGYLCYPFAKISASCFSNRHQTVGFLICQGALLVLAAVFAKITSGKPTKYRI